MTNIQYGFSTQPAFLQELAAPNSEFKSLFAAPAPVPPSIPPSSARRRASTSRVRRPQQPVVQSPRNLEVDNFGNFLRSLLQLQPAESYDRYLFRTSPIISSLVEAIGQQATASA